MRALVCLVVVTGCVTEQVAVTPTELLHHVRELREQGHAVVDVLPSGSEDLSADRRFDVTLGGKPVKLAVRDMIAQCPDDAPFRDPRAWRGSRCLLLGTRIEQFPLYRRHSVDWEVAGGIAAGLAVLAVISAPVAWLCNHPQSNC